MKKPNLFIIGQAKAGTTSLHDISATRAEIYANKNYKDYLFYKRFTGDALDAEFQKAYGRAPSNTKYILDSGANYCIDDLALKRISKIKSVKVILLVRDPIDNFISDFYYRYYRGRSNFNERDLLSMSENEIKEHLEPSILMSDILYQERLLKNQFLNESVFIIPFNDFKSGVYVDSLMDWLGLTGGLDTQIISNKTSVPKYPLLNSIFFGRHLGERFKELIPNKFRKKLGSIVRNATKEHADEELLKKSVEFKDKLRGILIDSINRYKILSGDWL